MSREISDFELSKAGAQKPEESPSASSSSRTSRDLDDSDSEESIAMSDEINKLHPNYKMSNCELTNRIRRIYLIKMRELADTSSRLLVTAARVSQRQVFPITSFNGFSPSRTISPTCSRIAATPSPPTSMPKTSPKSGKSPWN
jgi:hypothetical protein